MKEKKNIDRLFQENFKDFEVSPDDAVWEKIKARQHQKKRRAIILPFWYKVAGVAALLAIIFGIGYFSGNTDPVEDIVIEDTTIQDTEDNLTPNNDLTQPDQENATVSSNEKETQKSVSGDDKDQNQTNHITITNVPKIVDDLKKATETTVEKEPTTVANKPTQNDNTETAVANNSIKKNTETDISSDQKERNSILKNDQTDNAIVNQQKIETTPGQKETFLTPSTQENNSKETVVAQNNTNNNQSADPVKEKTENNPTTAEDPNKKSIFDAINQEEEAIAEEEKTNKKWNVSPNVAPVYYNSFGNGSSIDAQFADNSKSGQVNLSYGVQVSYNLNKRLSVRSGVNKVDLSYSTKDVGFTASSIGSQNLQSIDYNSNAEAILVSDIGANPNALSGLDISRDAIQPQNEGLLNQSIGYIEVPLEMKYALVNKKLGVNMIGGVSTLFLQNNEVSIEAGDFESTIGEANNLNEVSFTGNIGIGFDYKLSDQFQVNLEPIFKYQFNGFSGNTENFRPYYFGVYTGLSIKF